MNKYKVYYYDPNRPRLSFMDVVSANNSEEAIQQVQEKHLYYSRLDNKPCPNIIAEQVVLADSTTQVTISTNKQ